MVESILNTQPVSERDEQVAIQMGPGAQLPTNADVEFEQVAGIPADLVGPVKWDHPLAAHLEIVDREKAILHHPNGRRKKVCIVGYAENSRHLAWYNDPDCEIWGVNQLYRFIPRVDRWFQIHVDWNSPAKWATGSDLHEWLKTCPIPIYMTQTEPTIPNSMTYPKAEIMAALDVHDYFTSSIAYMIGLAIAEGFEHIGIYGIDLIIGREYFFEKACVEFYMGIAHARGIHVHKPENSALLWQSHSYGYETAPDYGFYNLEKLGARAKQLAATVQKVRDEVMQAQGKIDEAVWISERLQPEAKKEMDEHITNLRVYLDKKLNELYLHDGAHQEVSRMAAILEMKSRGAAVA